MLGRHGDTLHNIYLLRSQKKSMRRFSQQARIFISVVCEPEKTQIMSVSNSIRTKLGEPNSYRRHQSVLYVVQTFGSKNDVYVGKYFYSDVVYELSHFITYRF